MTTRVQVAKGTSVTVTETFAVDGAPIDLDAGVPTVTATAPDGSTTNPTASGAWTGRTTGQYRVVLPAQAEVTFRDLTWTGTIGGQPQTLRSQVEWVGEVLFTVGEMRAFRVGGDTPFSSAAVPFYSDAQIMDARAATLEEFTTILGFSPVPRFAREVVSVGYGSVVVLRHLFASRVLAVSVAGVAQSAAGYMIDEVNRLLPVSNYAISPWTSWGFGNVAVEYQHGWARPLGDCSQVAMLRAAMRLAPGLSSTATSVTTPDGVSYTFDAAGQVTQGGTTRWFGVPAIDSFLNRHRQAGLAVA